MAFTLIGADGHPYTSAHPGTLGGHRQRHVYGRLDCPTALSLIRRGMFRVDQRVFFASEDDAVAAGYRPCGSCLRERYREWRQSSD